MDWKRPLDSAQLEKITGKQSTLLPIAFLEMGLERAKAIARMDLGERGSGSGFLIGDDLLLTNHHVLENKAQARAAKAQFNYQQTLTGLAATCDEYELDPDSPDGLFKTSADDDWTAVKVKPKQGVVPGSKWAVVEGGGAGSARLTISRSSFSTPAADQSRLRCITMSSRMLTPPSASSSI